MKDNITLAIENEVKIAVSKEINDDIHAQQIYDRVLKLIELNEGKTIGKIFEKNAQYYFSDCQKVFLVKKYSWTSLFLTNNDREFDFNLGYLKTISVDEFKRTNTWANEPEHQRIQKNRAFLQSPNFPFFIENLKKVQEAIHFFEKEENSSFEIPALYSILRALEMQLPKQKDN